MIPTVDPCASSLIARGSGSVEISAPSSDASASTGQMRQGVVGLVAGQELMQERGGEPSPDPFRAPAAAGRESSRRVGGGEGEDDVSDVVGRKSRAEHARGGQRPEELQRSFTSPVFHLLQERRDVGLGGGCCAEYVEQRDDPRCHVEDLADVALDLALGAGGGLDLPGPSSLAWVSGGILLTGDKSSGARGEHGGLGSVGEIDGLHVHAGRIGDRLHAGGGVAVNGEQLGGGLLDAFASLRAAAVPARGVVLDDRAPNEVTPTSVRDAVRAILTPDALERATAQRTANEIAAMPAATEIANQLQAAQPPTAT